MIILFLFLFKLICSLTIKEAPLYEIIDLNDYYLSSFKKSVFYLSNSMNGEFIIQILDENINHCDICFNRNKALLGKCSYRAYLYIFKDNNLGSFSYSKIFLVFLNLGKIKIFNNKNPYFIEARNNQKIYCFDFYSHHNNLTFNLYFSKDSNTTINIQYSSNPLYPATINLKTNNSEKVFYSYNKYINYFQLLEPKYNYILDFSTPSENNVHSVLCLSFSLYDNYYVEETIRHLTLISPNTYTFYTYLLNSSNITGKKYSLIFQFKFNNSQYTNCSLQYQKLNNNSYFKNIYNCNLKTSDNRLYYINLTAERDDVILIQLFLNPQIIEMEYFHGYTFSYNKIVGEIDDLEDILYYIKSINNSLYKFLPISLIIILIVYFSMIINCQEDN